MAEKKTTEKANKEEEVNEKTVSMGIGKWMQDLGVAAIEAFLLTPLVFYFKRPKTFRYLNKHYQGCKQKCFNCRHTEILQPFANPHRSCNIVGILFGIIL